MEKNGQCKFPKPSGYAKSKSKIYLLIKALFMVRLCADTKFKK